MSKLLRDAVILDTETLGLQRGSGIYELAIYDAEQKRLEEYFFKPSRVTVESSVTQDVARLVSSSGDKAVLEHADFWANIIHANMGLKTADTELKHEILKQRAPFLYGQIYDSKGGIRPDAPLHLLGQTPSPTMKPATMPSALWKVQQQVAHETGVESVLRPGGALERAIRGKTVWIANAAFESKQIGSYIQAVQQAGEEVSLKNMFETYNPSSPDPFYVTGKEINEARLAALQTGDWTQVWKAYNLHTPKAGETAVRDILDVTRAYYSYAEKLGIASKGGKAYSGMGIDLTFRLFGSLESDANLGKQLLMTAEAHRAGSDVIAEDYVLRNAAKYTEALQHVYEDTKVGKQLRAEAKSGKGLLYEAQLYFDRLGHFQGEVERNSLLKRLQRAEADLATDGVSAQEVGFTKRDILQLDASGKTVNMRIAAYDRVYYQNMDQVLEHLEKEGVYGKSIKKEYAKMAAALGSATGEERVWAAERYVSEQSKGGLDKIAKSIVEGGLFDKAPSAPTLRTASTGKYLDLATEFMHQPGVLRGAALGAAGLGLAGALFGRKGEDYKEDRNITVGSYADYVAAYGEFEGMASQGWAKENRHSATDFGSPYRGPVVTSGVLYDQELLREREKYLQAEYHIKHFDPEAGLFGIQGPFARFKGYMPGGYNYINSGDMVDAQSYGLRGNNLRKLNVDDGWKMEVEDADTVTLKRGGVLGAISSFFGLNQGYAFRLEGIDAPEVEHGRSNPNSWHANQPGGTQSAQALRSMLENRSVSFIFDPTNTTYGRAVGVLYADGQNINTQLVKQGVVAALDYHKDTHESMMRSGPLASAEERAANVGRGIWSQPWMQAFRQFRDESGQGLTFNMLAKKDSLAKSAPLMSALSIMEQAQQMGAYTNAQAIRMSEQARHYHGGGDQVTPIVMGKVNAHYNKYMTEMQSDLSGYLTNKGNKRPHSMSHRSGYGKLDKAMALDTMGTSNTYESKPRMSMAEVYDSRRTIAAVRKAEMQRTQQRLNQNMFDSPIMHHMM